MGRALAWLASFRLRLVLRGTFVLLTLAVLAMAIAVLQEEKQRSYDNYQASFAKTKEQIVARLRHPAGQLALLNPPRNDGAPSAAVRPVVLPFSAIDFDDQSKVRNAVEMAGCLVQYRHYGSLCVAIGNNPWAGGFIYAAGTFASGALAPHAIGEEVFDGAHRLRVTLEMRGQSYRWVAPFELPPGSEARNDSVRGRFTGYLARDSGNYRAAQPVREFRGWLWQEGRCLDEAQAGNADCEKKSFFSLRLPVDALRDALFRKERPQWPPADLDQFRVRIEVLPPGDGAPLFDSEQEGAVAPFSLNDLNTLLLPGETLSIRKLGQKDKAQIAQLSGKDEVLDPTSPLLTRIIRRLPVESYDAPLELNDEVATPLGNYGLELKGDARSVNKALSAVASRVSWFVGAMLLAITLAWLIIEIGIVRRVAILTKRTRGLAKTVHADDGLERYELADLRGSDELGLLANGLNELLQRVKEDAGRERIRAEQEKDMWHAVGHEIMSPLQSLLVLHGRADDPSHRYIQRMQQAVRILYGSASPSEAFQSSNVQVQAVDIAAFLRHVAANAGIADVICVADETPLLVRADEYALEDVFAHILKNAERHRLPDTAITLSLEASEAAANITIHNHGPQIAADLINKIFEYGVSDQQDSAANGNRGQGLFVAKTYMAKMGGTVAVSNTSDGVNFVLGLQSVRT